MYDAIANCYDELIDAKYYAKWFDFTQKLLGVRERGVDVGCGSGIFTIELALRGKDVTGADESGAMLKKAMENARCRGLNIKFVLVKAERLRLKKKVEFITAMNDVVNYMKDPAPFFQAAYDSLEKDGLLLFDISSRYKLQNVIAGNTFFLQSRNYACVWENSKAAKSGAVDMNLNIFEKRADGLYERKEETHRQYAHDEQSITNKLKDMGFKVTVCADLTGKKPKADSQRIHFAAYKER